MLTGIIAMVFFLIFVIVVVLFRFLNSIPTKPPAFYISPQGTHEELRKLLFSN